MSFNLNQISAMSVQEMVRDGTPHDLYYYDSSNLFHQSRPTLSNTKFIQGFTTLTGGVNQLIFSPNQGLSDIIVNFTLATQNDLGGTGYTGYALNRGWGYAMVDQVAVRYGGSSQYFWSGEQMLIENCVDMEDAPTRDFIFNLGGDALIDTESWLPEPKQNVAYNASIYINLPHNSPNGDGAKPNPLPTELLRQPVLVQVSLRNPNVIFSKLNQNTPILAGKPLAAAEFQVRQVQMVNSSDLMTSHGDPSKIAYTLPLKYFAQQEYILTLPDNTTTAQVNLTGFRNGSVRSIILWLTNNADVSYVGANDVNNYFNWYTPSAINLSINGEIFYVSKTKQAQLLMDLVNNKQPNQLAITTLGSAGGAFTEADGTAEYAKVDFCQANESVFGVNMLVAGKSITNSVVNLAVTVPDPTQSWTLHAVYLYNSSLVFSSGNAEYVF